MNMNTKLLAWLLVFMMGVALNTNAAIVLKKQNAEKPAVTTVSASAESNDAGTTPAISETKATKKHSFISRAFTGAKAMLTGRAAIPAAAYIILCIFALGWLAIGLNDNFSGFSWILSLILYIIFYIPGLIYSLIMMGNYY
jgi:hypothetical protein